MDLKDTKSCPLIFGVEEAIEANRNHREDVFESIHDGEYCIDITHDGGWNADPTPIHFKDLTLVDTLVQEGCPELAMVDLHPEVEEFGCESGHYVIAVDDSLGSDAQVLAILDGLILLEFEKELRYLKTDDSEAPGCWRLTWHPPWKFRTPLRYTPSRPHSPKRSRRGRSR